MNEKIVNFFQMQELYTLFNYFTYIHLSSKDVFGEDYSLYPTSIDGEKELWCKAYFETDIAKTSTTKMSTAARSTFSNARTTNVNQLLSFFKKWHILSMFSLLT
jgi:hypothetical protein